MAGQAAKDMANGNTRLDFIRGLFGESYCVFEMIEAQRICFFFIFNASCALSAFFYESSQEERLSDLATCEANQKKICELTKQVYQR